MRSRTLLLLAGLLLHSTLAHGLCVHINWRVSQAGYQEAIQAEAEVDFMSINDRDITFRTVESSLIERDYYIDGERRGRKVVESVSEACFPNSYLVVDTNVVQFDFQIGDLGNLREGWDEARVYFLKDENLKLSDRDICEVILRAGDEASGGCTKRFRYSLDQLDETLGREIKELRSKAEESQKWQENFDDDQIELLEDILDRIEGLDFDEIREEDLADYQEALELWKSFKANVEELRRNISAELDDIRDRLASIDERSVAELEDQGISVQGQALYRTDAEIEFRRIELPPIPDVDPLVDDLDIYGRHADEVIETLQNYYRTGDRVGFLAYLGQWARSSKEMATTIANRTIASSKEWQLYNDSLKRIETYLYGGSGRSGVVDREHWFVDSPVDADTRRRVSVDLAKHNPVVAKSLQWELKQIRDDLSDEQKKVLLTIRVLAEGVANLAEEGQDLARRWNRGLEGAVHAVREGVKCVSTVAVAGDFGDLYEIVAGVDLCSGDSLTPAGRIISAGALLGGSAKFWRVIADVLGIGTTMRRLSPDIVEALEKLPPRVAAQVGDVKEFTKILRRLHPDKVPPVRYQGKAYRALNYRQNAQLLDAVDDVDERIARGCLLLEIDGKRYVTRYDPWTLGPRNRSLDHRYTGKGFEAIYSSRDSSTSMKELYYWIGGDRNEIVAVEKLIDYSGMLDISNREKVREILGLGINELTQDTYELPQLVGWVAKEHGYSGIIVPSARNEGGVNLVRFGR